MLRRARWMKPANSLEKKTMAPVRHVILAIALTAAAAAPTLGQKAPASGQAARAAPNTGSAPDFSGIWSHPYLTGFEPTASGPGPILNRQRTRNGVANFQVLVGDYTNPILQPWAAAVVKKYGEISLSGTGYPTPSNQCWPGGVPYVFWDFLLQILQEPDHITMLYRHGNELRHIRMNLPHREHVTPSWYGDSVGHYEGDVLVIDTVGIKIGPFAMVDMYGTPHSSALHVVERYRLLHYDDAKDAIARNERENLRVAQDSFDPDYYGKVLQLQFTVEDPGVFTTPWSSSITYRRSFNEWTELICAENTHEYYAGRETDVPHADRPDF
jgi:hypothetical protein